MFEFDGRNPIMLWTPVVEHDFGQERFLTDNPTKLYRLGRFARIPIMAGITKYEFMNPAICKLWRTFGVLLAFSHSDFCEIINFNFFQPSLQKKKLVSKWTTTLSN